MPAVRFCDIDAFESVVFRRCQLIMNQLPVDCGYRVLLVVLVSWEMGIAAGSRHLGDELEIGAGR